MPNGVAIPSDMLEPLGNKIGDLFSFRELDLILYKCSGDHIINGIANEMEPRRKTARSCLEAVERDGTLAPFLRLIAESPQSKPELRNLILQVAPGLVIARTDTKAKVDLVVSGLFQTHTSLDDPNIRAAVVASRETIRTVSKTVEILDVYKNLHDILHQMQMRRFSELRTAAVNMKADPAQADKLRDFQDRVRLAHQFATPWPPRLAHDSMAQTIEQGWVDKIGSAGDKLRTAIEQSNTAEACMALNVVLRILETEPSRINTYIFSAAKTLPLNELVETLNRVGAAAGSYAAVFKQAADALAAVRTDLHIRVVEHNLWQEIDDGLWAMDRHFILPPENALRDFGIDWPSTKLRVRTLADGEEGVTWAKNITHYSDRIDDEIVHIEEQLAPPGGAANIQTLTDNLYCIYTDFRFEARLRFLMVDQLLKSECEGLVAIGAPLQALLKELGNYD